MTQVKTKTNSHLFKIYGPIQVRQYSQNLLPKSKYNIEPKSPKSPNTRAAAPDSQRSAYTYNQLKNLGGAIKDFP